MILKRREIKSDEKLEFVELTESYGRAEFNICPVWKYGRLKEVFIYPRQQLDIDYYYHIGDLNSDSFQIMSWTFTGMKTPWIWLNNWCREHKCLSFHVYPPENSNCFYVSVLSTFQVIFERK